MIVAIEGVDASGKATQASLLNDAIARAGYATALYSFPRYHTKTGQIIRKLLTGSLHTTNSIERLEDMRITQCMMWADKLEASAEMLQLLQQDVDIICDRYSASSIAYGEAEGLDPKWLRTINNQLLDVDVQILLDTDPEAAAKRRKGFRDRNENDFEKLRAAREAYLRMWKDAPKSRGLASRPTKWRIIDASLPVDQVHRKVLNTVCSSYLDFQKAQDIRNANE